MRKGFQIYEEMGKYFPIYEEAVSHILIYAAPFGATRRLLSNAETPELHGTLLVYRCILLSCAASSELRCTLLSYAAPY
jgi:hypothetical protein